MILTFKIKHDLDLSDHLIKARKVAEHAIKTGDRSSASVKHIGLKSVIANQVLRKYGRDKKTKRISSVKLAIPSQGIKFDKNEIRIPCLKLALKNTIPREFQKINQIELDSIYAYVSVTIKEADPIQPSSWIGVDLNATGHCLVAANPSSGKVLKLGKSVQHVHLKYKNIRKNLQKGLKYNAVKNIKNRESRKVKDLNHKISSALIREAKKQKAGIVLEDLGGIRKTRKQARSFRYSLHSWSFYQLRKFIEYKAMLNGIPIVKIDPSYTSKQCSRCGLLGNRTGKKFKCPNCGNVEHADVNASFVIAERHQGIVRLPVERGAGKGSTDAPQEAMA